MRRYIIVSFIFALFILPNWNTLHAEEIDSLKLNEKNGYSFSDINDISLNNVNNPASLLAKSSTSFLSNSIAAQKPLVTDEWQFFIAPYLWFVGLNGDLAVNGQGASVDASFGDIWDQLDFAFQIHAEAMKGKYFFFIDETYMKLSIDQEIDPGFPVPVGGNVDIEVKMNTLEFGGGYRISAPKPQVPVYFDLYAGGRWWIVDLDQKIKFNNLPDQSTDQNEQWVDLFVGARMIALLTENLIATVKTDIGGFDFGFSSKFTWNIIANLGWDTGWNGFTPFLGWRTMYVDYEDGSGSDFFQYNVWMNGIQAGLGFRF